ncbi:MAG: hypothetical protein CR984_06390 [Proteobacteria bacterium]|nr:MAG: hypothetical protein CR984_06390 [Pseudomonadota bacterium]PIE68109.1 MAG: hypothetical protein CSA23_00610 [Deltaproteobacteria bacterium]
MPTIAYDKLSEYIGSVDSAGWPAVTLVCGEELLCKKALGAVIDLLVPVSDQNTAVERVDGAEAPVTEALSALNTYALLSVAKVVVLHDARLFYSAKAQQGLREKMTTLARSGEMEKASRPLLNLMALLNLSFEDLETPAGQKKLLSDGEDPSVEWFSQLRDHCRDNRLRVPEKRNDADRLADDMAAGFPDGHRLVITTDFVDRRKALYKKIDESGLIVDCNVPKGETRADRMAREAVMQAAIDEGLAGSGKKIAIDARNRLIRLTGFDLRILGTNLEKLVDFTGDRQTISEADVTAVLQRSRKDPIFEFTNALAERNLNAMLGLMQSLLEDGMHPLQLLAAAANQLRRLLLAKEFIRRDQGASWTANMAFPRFKGAAFQAVQNADAALGATREEWQRLLEPPADGKKKKKSGASDLVLVRNTRSPFPVYQTLKNADQYSLDELQQAMIRLSETDVKMKSTGQDLRLLLEAFLIRLCRKRG